MATNIPKSQVGRLGPYPSPLHQTHVGFDFTFAVAVELWRVQDIKLVLDLPLLRQDPINPKQKLIYFRTMLFRNSINIPLNITVDMPQRVFNVRNPSSLV